MPDIQIYADAETLAQAAANFFIQTARECVERFGAFSVALSGGTTPQTTYALLSTDPYRRQVDWPHVHFFWGDERCVPPDHADSNYRKAAQALLERVPVPPENIHRFKTELEPKAAALAYEDDLLAFFPSLTHDESRLRAGFDLALLGMGDDGHTASLFPGTAAIHESARWTAAHYVDRLGAWRVTLTPALLNRSARVLFQVSGAAKSRALQRVLYGAYLPDRFPAQVIRPQNGTVTWMVDEEAASLF